MGGATASSSSASAGGAGGSGGTCPSPGIPDPTKADREACKFAAGDKVSKTLGLSDATRASIPIDHLIIVMQENRSFDHYFGQLATSGQPDAESPPAGFSNLDKKNVSVPFHHLTSTCLEADPPHQWVAMHFGYDDGKMDGFVRSAAVDPSDGHFVMGTYGPADLPFYYWLAKTYSIADHYFGAALGGTWANRDYLYAGTSNSVMNTGGGTIPDNFPTIYSTLDKVNVPWGVYTSGDVRQNCLGWNNNHNGVHSFQAFLDGLDNGSLPAVSFVDPGPAEDEHPTGDAQKGEAWGRTIYTHAVASPLWMKLAIVYTYDEAGGLADHVVPPKACIPSPDQAEFDRLGIRVPAIVISPWARKSFVSHEVHEHSSTLRLIELLSDIPALTARDANSDALLDMFDFSCPALANPPPPPDAGKNGCK
jgi:phospholipase C